MCRWPGGSSGRSAAPVHSCRSGANCRRHGQVPYQPRHRSRLAGLALGWDDERRGRRVSALSVQHHGLSPRPRQRAGAHVDVAHGWRHGSRLTDFADAKPASGMTVGVGFRHRRTTRRHPGQGPRVCEVRAPGAISRLVLADEWTLVSRTSMAIYGAFRPSTVTHFCPNSGSAQPQSKSTIVNRETSPLC